MESLTSVSNKYSGFDTGSIIFLINNSAKVSVDNISEAWNELMSRYFNNGRTFNLYDVILKISENSKYVFFSLAMEFELKNSITALPVEHSESFIKLILLLIDFVQDKVLKDETVSVEWSIHEFYGLADMLEKVKQAKIVNPVLRQEINVFIDSINLKRKNIMDAIEATKQLVPVKEKVELMSQELNHLNIPTSKLGKEALFSALNNIDIYYLEDAEKLIKKAAKTYSVSFMQNFPDLALMYFIEHPQMDVNYLWLLKNAYPSSHNITKHMDLEWIFDWVKSIGGYTEDIGDRFTTVLAGKYWGNKYYKDMLMKHFSRYYYIIEECKGKKLSEILDMPPVEIPFLDNLTNYTANMPKILWNDGFVFEKSKKPVFTINRFQYVDLFKGIYQDNLYCYHGWNTKASEVTVLAEIDTSHIENFCNFYQNIIIDDAGLARIKENIEFHSKMFDVNTNSLKMAFVTMVRCRACNDCFTESDKKFLFKDYYPSLMGANVSVNRGCGWYAEPSEYLEKYYADIVELYDFEDADETKRFFNIHFMFENAIHEKNDFGMNFLNVVYDKLVRYFPSEVYLLNEFFDFSNKKDAENSTMWNINKKDSSFVGVKISVGNSSVVVNPEKAKKYYVVRFFFDKFSHNSI